MCLWEKLRSAVGAALVLCAAVAAGACQQPTVNENAGGPVAATNINSSNSANVTTSTVTTTTGTTIETKEPEKYSATVTVEAASSGQQSVGGKTEIKVARNGSDRRYSINTGIPGVGEIIFLDKADKRYFILPARRQYAELTSELTGFDVGRSLTPGQLVAY